MVENHFFKSECGKSGKTTLLKQFVKDYISFDDEMYLRLAEKTHSGDSSIKLNYRAGLDECQKVSFRV